MKPFFVILMMLFGTFANAEAAKVTIDRQVREQIKSLKGVLNLASTKLNECIVTACTKEKIEIILAVQLEMIEKQHLLIGLSAGEVANAETAKLTVDREAREEIKSLKDVLSLASTDINKCNFKYCEKVQLEIILTAQLKTIERQRLLIAFNVGEGVKVPAEVLSGTTPQLDSLKNKLKEPNWFHKANEIRGSIKTEQQRIIELQQEILK